MRNDDKTIVCMIEISDHLDYGFECVDVESTVDFIQKNIFWFEKLELKDLYFSPLSSAESDIEISS